LHLLFKGNFGMMQEETMEVEEEIGEDVD